MKRIYVFTAIVLMIAASGCLQKAVENVKTPQTDLSIKVDGISDGNLELSVDTLMTNPNPVSIDLDDISVVMKNTEGKVIKETTLKGGTIDANREHTFNSKLSIPVSLLNEKTIVTNMQTKVGAAGLDIKLPVEAKTTLQLPSVSSLMKMPEINTDITVKIAQSKADIEVTIKNGNSFGLMIDDVAVDMFDADNNKIGDGNIPGGKVSGNSEKKFPGEVILKKIPSGNKVNTTVKTNFGLENVAEKLPFKTSISTDVESGVSSHAPTESQEPSTPPPLPPVPTLPPPPGGGGK